ncbi:MAG: cell division protein FtsQ/DivIB [Nevskia sp.]|nr:cell division protein FtsQ/DivIB [Nevskia sp.]
MSGAVTMPMGDTTVLPWLRLLPAIVAATLLAAAVLLSPVFKQVLDQPVQTLRVDGTLTRLRPQQIAAAAAVEPGALLFDLDLEAVRSRVEALPWVAHARVTRIWPARLAVRVWERQPYALWGDKSLVDDEGVVFTPLARDLPDGLPRLDGPAGREATVMRDYRELAAALGSGAFAPKGLKLDARGSWTLYTAGGLELRLGEDDPRDKVGLILGTVSRTLAPQLDRVSYIDLRYRNGFAVGWANGSKEQCSEAHTAPGPARPDCVAKNPLPPAVPVMPAAATAAGATEGIKHD